MQDSGPCSAHRANATQDDLRNVVPSAVEKMSGSTAAVTKLVDKWSESGREFQIVGTAVWKAWETKIMLLWGLVGG